MCAHELLGITANIRIRESQVGLRSISSVRRQQQQVSLLLLSFDNEKLRGEATSNDRAIMATFLDFTRQYFTWWTLNLLVHLTSFLSLLTVKYRGSDLANEVAFTTSFTSSFLSATNITELCFSSSFCCCTFATNSSEETHSTRPESFLR